MAMAHCVHRTGTVVSVGGESIDQPGCPTGVDTHGPWAQLPRDTGAIVDGSLSYAYTRHMSLTGALAYEPLPGTVVPEFLSTYVQTLRPDLEVSHEISTFLVWQRGQEVAAVPEAVRLTETVVWAFRALLLEGGGFVEPALGLLGRDEASIMAQPLVLADLNNGVSVVNHPQGAGLFSLTAGLSAAAELRLTRYWSMASAVTASSRHGDGYGPATFIDLNLLSVILHYRGWSDQLALEMASVHPGGPYNAAIELSLTRHL